MKEMEKVDEGKASLFKDGDSIRVSNKFADWFIRRYFKKRIDDLRGNADEIQFTRITFDAENFITVEYVCYDS